MDKLLFGICKYYRFSAAAILLFTAGIKIISVVIGGTSARPNPVFQLLTDTELALLVAGIEVFCAVICIHSRVPVTLQMQGVIWLMCAFLTYRWLAAGRGSGCQCFGSLLDQWNIANKHSNLMAWLLLVYLGTGSLAVLGLKKYLQHRQSVL